ERWRYRLPDTMAIESGARAVIVGAGGDAVVGGSIRSHETGEDFLLVRLRASDGALVWRQQLTTPSYQDDAVFDVRLDPAGDVVAAGTLAEARETYGEFAVAKLRWDDGAEVWRHLVEGAESAPARGEARAVAVDSSGDVVATGLVVGETSFIDFTVAKMSGL